MKVLIFGGMLFSLVILLFWGLLPWLAVMGVLIFLGVQSGREPG